MTAKPKSNVAIHVAVDLPRAARLESALRRQEYSVVRVDLTGVDDRLALCGRLGEAFLFPYAVTSLDAVVDLVSDLEWLGNDFGFLVEIRGLDDLRPETIKDAVGLLPAICDRWRSQRRGFVVLLIGLSHRATILAGLTDANCELSAAAGLPWVRDTGPVEIVDHGVHLPRSSDGGEV
ncbi:MAG: hypothetical protein EBT09_11910 [Actinobacteria bacterium]|jgi:hypothetical protein|nr:hypothetical protein [Actinomycetota bacterium]